MNNLSEPFDNLPEPTKERYMEMAAKMAVDINGGSWDRDYTDAQKKGWCIKVQYFFENYRRM